MKKFYFLVTLLAMVLITANLAFCKCATIKDGTITDAQGNIITNGYDKYGYNYQAHMFNGLYENYSRPEVPVTEGLEKLVMKWSDDWLSNKDCNDDGKLDRGLDAKTGTSTGISQGWLTNHFEGEYLGNDGEYHHYTYFVKIVFVGPAPNPDPWASKRIWGQYAIIEEVNNDAYGGFHGVNKDQLVNPAGLGFWTN
jgi:hypothetical protein